MQEIQQLCGEDGDNIAFVLRLNKAAHELGLPPAWNGTRMAKVRTGAQDLSIDDVTVLAHVDPMRRGWTYVAYGVPVTRKGEDPFRVLMRLREGYRRASP